MFELNILIAEIDKVHPKDFNAMYGTVIIVLEEVRNFCPKPKTLKGKDELI